MNGYALETRENGNAISSRSSPSNPSEDFSCDTFPPRVSLAWALISKLHYNAFSISAFATMHQRKSFPVPSEYETIEGAAAAVLVLATRASLSPSELTSEAILTLLWILQSYHSQYGSDLRSVVRGYTKLLKPCSSDESSLRYEMLSLQRTFLARLDWNIRLDNTQEINYAFKTLSETPGFSEGCFHIKSEAERLLDIKNEETPPIHVPVQFSSSRLLNRPANLPLASPPAFPAASYVTPTVSYRFLDTPFSSSALVNYDAAESEEEYFLSDYKDIYSDLEDQEERFCTLAATSRGATSPLARAPHLGKRQHEETPATTDINQQPPRKKLLGGSGTGIFQAVRRSFFDAFLQRP